MSCKHKRLGFWNCFALATIVFSLAFIVYPASQALAGTTERVSVGPGGVECDGLSLFPSISADGRYVAFHSNATNLVVGDNNGTVDVFVHDRETHLNTLASVNSTTGLQGDSNSNSPALSADGRVVSFTSWATNLEANPAADGLSQVFTFEMAAGPTSLVSRTPGDARGNSFSSGASTSWDGQFVAFQSTATDLVAPATTVNMIHNYVYDRVNNQTTLVTVTPDGQEGNNGNELFNPPSLSANGRFVAFDANATNLVNGGTNGVMHIFVRDLTPGGVTTLVSVGPGGVQGNDRSYAPSISADGRYVAFMSIASNLTDGSTGATFQIFVHDRLTQETTCVSTAPDGAEGNGLSENASISADGRYVAFSSVATNLVADDTNNENDVFVHDRNTGLTVRISVDSAGAEAVGGGSSVPRISANNRFVVFHSAATNLVADDTNVVDDIFVRDLTGDFPPEPAPAGAGGGGGGGCFANLLD